MLLYRNFSHFTGFQMAEGGTVRSRHPISITRNKGWGATCKWRCEEVCAMSFLVFKAYLKLILFDLYLARGNFAVFYDKVRNYPVKRMTPAPDALECVCSAVDMACIWYWKEALCLQRSAATSCLLKTRGIVAQMVIGAQQLPFKAHAWVEVDGRVVNDKPYVMAMYSVLDRC
jgi:hypothetical protein